jgi:hypothetical protein
MPTWPVSLPTRVLLEGFEATLPSTVIETQMDTGPAKRRRRFTAAVTPYAAMLRITAAQLATFIAFFQTDTAGGALTFDGLAHPLTGAAATHRFMKPGDSPPSYHRVGHDTWQVSFGLEVMP